MEDIKHYKVINLLSQRHSDTLSKVPYVSLAAARKVADDLTDWEIWAVYDIPDGSEVVARQVSMENYLDAKAASTRDQYARLSEAR